MDNKTRVQKLEDTMYKQSPIKTGKLFIKDEDKALSNYNKIIPRLFLGNYDGAKDKEFFKRRNIKAVLNCSKDIPNNFASNVKIEYMRIPVDDLLRENDFETMFKFANVAAEFIHKHADLQKNNIFVHCQMGRQRSVTCIVFYLMKYHKMNPEQACKLIVSKRPESLHFSTSTNFAKSMIRYYEYLKQTKCI